MDDVARRSANPVTASPAAKKPAPADMPPRVPQTIKDLEDAVVLLGAYVQAGGAIRKSRLDRLHELIGMLPRLEDAPKWKRSLKVLRATLVAGAKPSTGV